MELISSHKYIKNACMCATVLIKYLLGAGERFYTTKKARKTTRWPGRMKEKHKRKKELRQDLCPWEGTVKEEKFSDPGSPLHWLGDPLGQRGSFRGSGESASTHSGRRNHVAQAALPSTGDTCAHVWRAGAETQASTDKPKEGTRVGCTETARRDWRVEPSDQSATAGCAPDRV